MERILMVDDDTELCELVQEYLTAEGFTLEVVHDGETAAVVVQGSVELDVGGQRQRINAGGGFQILGKQPYRLTNTGRQTAIVVCACTPSLV